VLRRTKHDSMVMNSAGKHVQDSNPTIQRPKAAWSPTGGPLSFLHWNKRGKVYTFKYCMFFAVSRTLMASILLQSHTQHKVWGRFSLYVHKYLPCVKMFPVQLRVYFNGISVVCQTLTFLRWVLFENSYSSVNWASHRASEIINRVEFA
jgi:hypothetical protein